MNTLELSRLFVASARQAIQNRFKCTSMELDRYWTGKIDAYRELLYSLGMSHKDIDFQLFFLPETSLTGSNFVGARYR